MNPRLIDSMLRQASDAAPDGGRLLVLIVPEMRCGACISRIEKGLATLDLVRDARVNLSEHTVTVEWTGSAPHVIAEKIEGLGFSWHLPEAESDAKRADDATMTELVRATAVAGFAAGNIMLFSVSIWAGAAAETRDLFHWISALIAVPAVGYSVRPFLRSAWRALSARRINMDVPISLAVLLALAMSLYETATSGAHAYYDAAATLLFFLLIGRVLDHLMRRRARRQLDSLSALVPNGATVIGADGSESYTPLEEIQPGSRILIRPGDRIPLDAKVLSGGGDIDCSLVSGESAPAAASVGDMLQAGTHNLNGVLEAETVSRARNSFLARMRDLMLAAESGKSRYRGIADRMAEIYAPAVHLLALATFIGWMLVGGDWHQSMFAAISVLIITCPCALGLAVPMVQVVASGRLSQAGILMKNGEALERLAGVRHAFFDKTGTLTLGKPRLLDPEAHADEDVRLASSLAVKGSHPLGRALVAEAKTRGLRLAAAEQVREHPGCGIEGMVEGRSVRLGRSGWCGGDGGGETGGTLVVLAIDGEIIDQFDFEDSDRPRAAASLAELGRLGIGSEILSGDRQAAVDAVARRLGVDKAHGGLLPEDKIARLSERRETGQSVLMVGDGLNDAPVMAAADVSIAPISAADIGRGRADFVFLRDSLHAVPETVTVARDALSLIRQNIGIALLYNSIAVPLAMLGFVTPLVAAVAMSSSSVLVTLNALRLYRSENIPAATTPVRLSEAAT